ncbi:hypothetical protein ACW9HW_12165 [Pseudomonas sp. SDO5532_S415]
MASSFQKLTAEQVRARYRQSFPRADLLKPTIVDAMDDTGLIHSSKLDFALNVTIPEWSERPPFPGPVNVLRMEWLLPSSNQWRDFGDPEDIPGPIEAPDLDFPLERSIPVDVFRDHEGPFEFRYRVKNWNNATERVSATAPVLLDRSGPVWVNPLTAMIDIVEKPVITDAVLARDLGVYCIIPDFVEANRVDVWVKVYWMTRPPLPTENIADFQVLSIQLPPDRKVLIPEDVIKGYGSKTQFAVAVLFDKAGNPGERSLPATVPVALGTLPSGLQPCTVPLAEDAETLIDRADAAYPTEVHIKEYTGWHDSHGVQIWWGGHKLPITSVGAHSKWPLKIPVPWSIMSLVYDFDSTTHVQDIDVDYQILVGDYPFDSPGPVNINTDFAIPKPGDPDPDPIDISLNLIEFLSFSGSSTELTLSDIDEDATVFIELYDDPEIGVTFTPRYNGVPLLAAPYEVNGSETPNQKIPFTVTWDEIKQFPVMENLPIDYTLTHPDFINPQQSLPTHIDVLVETVQHPDPQFPELPGEPANLINCNFLREKGGVWGIIMHIPKSTYLKKNTAVELEWKTYEPGGTVIAIHPETRIVSQEEEDNGLDWLVPHDKCLKPTYPDYSYGVGKMKYTITVRGTPVPSTTVERFIAVFEADGGAGNMNCKIPRP